MVGTGTAGSKLPGFALEPGVPVGTGVPLGLPPDAVAEGVGLTVADGDGDPSSPVIITPSAGEGDGDGEELLAWLCGLRFCADAKSF